MKNPIHIFCILICFSINAIGQTTNIFELPFPQQLVALDSTVDVIIQQSPEIANQFLKQLEADALASEEAISIINFKRGKLRNDLILGYDAKDKAALNRVHHASEELLKEFDEQEYPEIAALLHVNIGHCLDYDNPDGDYAFDHFLKAYELFKSMPVGQMPSRHYDQYAIALAFYNYGDYESAIALCEDIISLYPELNVSHCFTRVLLGISYLLTNQFEKALDQYTWVLQNNKACGMGPLWQGIALDGIGQARFYLNNSDEALTYMRRALDVFRTQAAQTNFAETAATLSRIYTSRNEIAMASTYLDSSATAFSAAASPKEKLRYYKAAIDYCRKTDDFQRLSSFQDSLLSINDPLTARRNVNLVRNSQLRVTEELKQKKELQSQEQLAKEKALRVAYTLALIFILLSGLLLVRNIRQRHEADKKLADQYKKMAEIEFSEARTQIEAYVQLLIIKNSQIKEADDAFEQYKTALAASKQGPHATSEPEVLENESVSNEFSMAAEKKLINEKILTKEDWLNFIQLFNRLHPHFINTIETKYPALTASEIRYCVLTRLSLSNKQITSMLGVGEDAVRQTTSRINKKLHLKSKNEIVDLVMGID